jgi:hypothetical protein
MPSLQEECRRSAIECLDASRVVGNREEEIVFLELAQRLRCLADALDRFERFSVDCNGPK